MLNPGIYHSLPKSIKLLAIHADKNGKFDNESLWISCDFVFWGRFGCKTEPFARWKSQCLIIAREEVAANLKRLQSSSISYERHGPHESNMMGDQIGVSDY
jgi:hypothetical protein